jgi:predicted nucleic acid-binding protein
MTVIEPGIVDANVLVYAINADAPQYLASRTLLEAGRRAPGTFFVSSQILCEFYSIITNPRRVSQPRSVTDGSAVISRFLRVLPIPGYAAEAWVKLLGSRPVTGGKIFDLQIVATMHANGVGRIYTSNSRDFDAFSELQVTVPSTEWLSAVVKNS